LNQRGTSAIEYAIMLMAVAAAITLGVSLFGIAVKHLFSAAANIFRADP